MNWKTEQTDVSSKELLCWRRSVDADGYRKSPTVNRILKMLLPFWLRHHAAEVHRRFIMRRCGAAQGSGSACTTTTHPLSSHSSRVKCAKQRCWINPTQLRVLRVVCQRSQCDAQSGQTASTAQMSWGERCDCVRSRTLQTNSGQFTTWCVKSIKLPWFILEGIYTNLGFKSGTFL